MKKSILHRITLLMLLWVLSVAYATGQDLYRVTRGSVHEYKIPKPAIDINYSWQVFTDVGLTSLADAKQAVLTPMGKGRENEIKVKWQAEGEYYLLVSVSDAKGCSNRMAWHFAVSQSDNKPVARIVGPSIVLLGNCDDKGHVLDASTSSGEGLIFSWSPSIYLDNATSSKPKFHVGKTTRYHLTVTDSEGQKDTTSILVVVANPPKAVTDKNVFAESAKANILLNGSKSSGAGLTYLWLSKEGIILSGITQATAEVSGLGMYYLSVTDLYGCIARDSVNVGIYIQAISDTARIKVNESVIINVVSNDIPQNAINPSSISIKTPPSHGTASITDDLLVLYQPEKDYTGQDEFVYSICDYFSNCDNAKVLVLINDMPLFIPEAFSPNGDGINDEFEIKGLAKYKTVEIEIFNRWGNVVYQSNNYGTGEGKDGFWNGKASSSMRVGSGPVASGTYYYVLKINGHENISGAVYIDR